MDISFQIDESFESKVDTALIEKALGVALDLFNPTSSSAPPPSVVVVVTDNETIQQLNYQYLGIDSPTDVLSFENIPDPDFPEVDEAMLSHLGEIIIAYPVAQAQASAAGHAPQDEVTLLAVHGLLHLLGFDHDTPENRKNMWAAQHQIMTELGLAHVQPTEN
jgi:probable rRNA maturation factor